MEPPLCRNVKLISTNFSALFSVQNCPFDFLLSTRYRTFLLLFSVNVTKLDNCQNGRLESYFVRLESIDNLCLRAMTVGSVGLLS